MASVDAKAAREKSTLSSSSEADCVVVSEAGNGRREIFQPSVIITSSYLIPEEAADLIWRPSAMLPSATVRITVSAISDG